MAMAWGTTIEEMLRWQIDRTRKWLEDSRKGIAEAGEIYQLPQKKGEPPAGTPEGWVETWGEITPHELSLKRAADSFQFAAGVLDRADEALSNRDFPAAINLMVQARDGVWSTTTAWSSSHAVKMYRYVEKVRQSYRLRGGMKKQTIRIDGEDGLSNLTQMVDDLALMRDFLGDYLPASDLWNELIGLMDISHLEPKEIAEPEKAITFLKNDEGDRKELKFNTFKVMLSQTRRKLSKHS